MAGRRARSMIEVAANAAGRVARAAERVEDAWAAPEHQRFTPADLKSRLQAAGHQFGAGFDGCVVCVEMANALPRVLAQAQQQEMA